MNIAKFLIFFLLCSIIFAFMFPATAICSLASHQMVSEGDLPLVNSAVARIKSTFGDLKSNPNIIFYTDSSEFWPLKLNTYGTAAIVGNKVCVFIGEDGRNIDVIAHELLHGEVFYRVGHWNSFVELPVWFNEGLAMQVDYRKEYDLPQDVKSNYVTELDAAREFFVSDEAQLTSHYASAKIRDKNVAR